MDNPTAAIGLWALTFVVVAASFGILAIVAL